MIDHEAIVIIEELTDIIYEMINEGWKGGYNTTITDAINAAAEYVYKIRGPKFEERKEHIDWVAMCQHRNNNYYEFYLNRLTGDIVQAQCKTHAINHFGCKGHSYLVKRIFRVTWDNKIIKN